MAYTVVNLPPLIASGTSAGSFSNGIGALDDADRIMLFMVSTANAASTVTAGLTLQVSQFDPNIPIPTGVTMSTKWHAVSTAIFPVTASSGGTYIIDGAGFRGLRLSGLTSAVASETIAYVTKFIVVD